MSREMLKKMAKGGSHVRRGVAGPDSAGKGLEFEGSFVVSFLRLERTGDTRKERRIQHGADGYGLEER